MSNGTKFSAKLRECVVRTVQEGRGEHSSLRKAVNAYDGKLT